MLRGPCLPLCVVEPCKRCLLIPDSRCKPCYAVRDNQNKCPAQSIPSAPSIAPDCCSLLIDIDDQNPRQPSPRQSRASRHQRLPPRQSSPLPRTPIFTGPPATSAPPHRPQRRRPLHPHLHGTRSPSMKSQTACNPSRAHTAPNPSCLTATQAPAASSTSPAWTAASSIASAPPVSTAPSAPPPAWPA